MVKPAAPEAPRLSLAVITFNEEKHLPRLLEAARNADEVVVVDSGSTDATVAIARSHGARVIESDWPGFGRQKQRALEEARGEWVLSLDVDELPDAQLTESLAAVARGEGDEFDGYAMDRLTAYQGEYIRHAWSPDWVLRLVRRGRGRWTDRPVHEALVVDGSVGRLKERFTAALKSRRSLHAPRGLLPAGARRPTARGVASLESAPAAAAQPMPPPLISHSKRSLWTVCAACSWRGPRPWGPS
ncbi:MAG: glycosyltransferase family 2 protein [Acidobacteriota bacterium]|nr:glycosyltransferase family 2 protein [Acidobacteriota bacterium]